MIATNLENQADTEIEKEMGIELVRELKESDTKIEMKAILLIRKEIKYPTTQDEKEENDQIDIESAVLVLNDHPERGRVIEQPFGCNPWVILLCIIYINKKNICKYVESESKHALLSDFSPLEWVRPIGCFDYSLNYRVVIHAQGAVHFY